MWALGKGLYELRIRHDANEIRRERDPEPFARIGPLPAEPTLLQRGQIIASMETVSRLSKPLGLHLALVPDDQRTTTA